jgi:hypothetical protein
MTKHSCDHVLPVQNFLPLLVENLDGHQFDFRFQNQTNPIQLEALCQLLLNSSKIPALTGGIVVFLPSHSFKNKLVDFLRTKQTPIYDQMIESHSFFVES